MTHPAGPITVAAGQISARLMNEADQTLASIETSIVRAAERHVDLLVLPECAYPAYLLGSVASYRAGDHLSSDAFVAWLTERAARHRLHIVSGFVEDTTDGVYNSAIVIDDTGRAMGRARKRFLWHVDHDWYRPGHDLHGVDTALGRIGVVICAETRAPEIVATLAADHVRLLVMPTCWINGSREPGGYENPQTDFLIEARAREFGIPFVCADKSGVELPPMGYVGQSRIVLGDGTLAAEAGPTGEEVITAKITLSPPKRVWVSDAQRQRLSDERVAQPADEGERSVTVAAIPTAMIDTRFDGGMGETLFKPLQQAGVDLLLMNVTHEAQADQLQMLARAFDIHAIGFPDRTDVFDLGLTRVGCVAGQWVGSFAASRILALDGAQVLFMFDVPMDLAVLRTRAAENRVFVVGANTDAAIVIGPDGTVLARSDGATPTAAIATLDLSRAADKTVAPQTDIFAERRVELYRF